MAHVGLYYKLHFRRDVSQNVTPYHRFAYGETYFMTGAFHENQPWTAGFPVPWVSAIGVEGISPMLAYTWPQVTFNGMTWDLKWTITQPNTPAIAEYQRVVFKINGAIAYDESFGGTGFGSFQTLPSFPGTIIHTNTLTGQLAIDFGNARWIARYWPLYS
jgi:hypothetical protein